MKKTKYILPLLFLTLALAIGLDGYNTHGLEQKGLIVTSIFLAMLSFTLFMIAFLASSLLKVYPGRITQWLVQNRRYIGISFGLTHIVHGIAISIYMYKFGVVDISWITLIAGGLAYVVLFALLCTSHDKAVEKLGAKWHTLHTWGMYYIWFVFTYTLVTKAIIDPQYVPSAIIPILALFLKLYAHKK